MDSGILVEMVTPVGVSLDTSATALFTAAPSGMIFSENSVSREKSSSPFTISRDRLTS